MLNIQLDDGKAQIRKSLERYRTIAQGKAATMPATIGKTVTVVSTTTGRAMVMRPPTTTTAPIAFSLSDRDLETAFPF